jgi:glycosyltransferase involved in cell wall biosynthesis
MHKLLFLAGEKDGLGGTLVSRSMLALGFKQRGAAEQLQILVQADSFMEQYLRDAGHGDCLQLIAAKDRNQFMERSLHWVNQQPKHWPLLLDNCADKEVLPAIMKATPALRLSGRPVYHFCHDLCLSHNALGYALRKLVFTCLAPRVLCNSQFTAAHVRSLMPNIQRILYMSVDLEQFKFQQRPSTQPAPEGLKSIVQSGARLMLTPSRINQAGIINDKNLRALIPVIAQLKVMGHHYHSVVIGPDSSPDKINTRALIEQAKQAGVADRFTILPPMNNIEDCYKHADIVVTLAPREPFGRTVVEAIASGVPVVGSRTGGISEILQHFAPHWAVDPNNPVAVAETILRVAADPMTTSILASGRAWVEQRCSVMEYARGVMEATGITHNGTYSENTASHIPYPDTIGERA